jgi:hypothetical protein
VRRVDRWWWTLFGVGVVAWLGVLAGVYAGWEATPLLFAGLGIYGLARFLGYHRLGIRPPRSLRKQ